MSMLPVSDPDDPGAVIGRSLKDSSNADIIKEDSVARKTADRNLNDGCGGGGLYRP